MKSRIFRALICLLVICCLLVNISPIKAEATTVVAGSLSFEALLAILYSLGIGVVATDLTIETWNKIGTNLEEGIITGIDVSELQKYYNLKQYWESIDPDPPEDPGEWHQQLKEALAGGLLTAIAAWLCTLVNLDGYEIDSDKVQDGWAIYGDVLLPEIPTVEEDLPYVFIAQILNSYYVYYSSAPLYKKDDSNYIVTTQDVTYTYRFRDVSATDARYNSSGLGTAVAGKKINSFTSFVWCNYDMYSTSGELVLSASEPVYRLSEVISPEIYVGDIPQQIKDGEKDKDNLNLPVLDPFKLINSPETAFEDITQMQQALKDGTITVDQYLEQVQVPTQTDPDVPEDPSESTEPSTSPPEPDEDTRENSAFTLDLTEFFPFCIPFDIYEFLSILAADPVAPVFTWEIAVPQLGQTFEIDVDLSTWDEVAALFRKLELFGFIVGLAYVTRKSYLRG